MWPANCRRAYTTCSSGLNYDTLEHRPQVSADRPASTFSDENSLLSYLLCLLMADLFYYMVSAFHVLTALSTRPKYSTRSRTTAA